MITASDILDELHIDITPQETATVTRLLLDASALIRVSIKRDLTDDQIMAVNSPLYERLIITLVTYMYYQRDMSTALPLGAQVLLDNLRWEVLDSDENVTVSTQ